jgi:serine/threonine-protein kinase
MQVISAQELIVALQGSGLFTREQFGEIVREMKPFGDDSTGMMRHLVASGRLTRYQLKKIAHGKGTELILGPFVITDKLGEGGMGKVYRARRAEGGKDTFALKVVRAALVSNPIVRGRYAREVQTAGTLDHPNIVRLFDAGEAQGRFYLAMEFVDGLDLARLMHDYGKLEVVEACEYVRQAALGLQHAHEKGFVHRDIKPSNIVVAGERHLPQATEASVVKLLDLGLARAIDPDDMVVPNLTRDHTVVGTPDYMAPEQAKNSKGADPRSDLYSLGCTFYFLLAGQVPFPRGGAIEKILAHQSETPTPIQLLQPRVPAGVAQIVTRLLTKRPEERIQTAGELAALLAPHAKYPDDASPVEITVRDSDAQEAAAPSVAGGAAGGPPSSTSMPGPLTLLELEEDKVQNKSHRPVAPSDPTPRPRPDSPGAPERPSGRRPKPQVTARKPHKKAPRNDTPQWVWCVIALLGVAVLALMLWILSNR